MRGLGDLGKVHSPFRAAMLIVHIGRRRSDLRVKNLNLEENNSQLMIICAKVMALNRGLTKLCPSSR